MKLPLLIQQGDQRYRRVQDAGGQACQPVEAVLLGVVPKDQAPKGGQARWVAQATEGPDLSSGGPHMNTLHEADNTADTSGTQLERGGTPSPGELARGRAATR